MSKRSITPVSKTPIDVAGISSSIFQIAPDAIVVIDDAQNIVFFNQGAEKIFMYEAAEVTGKALELLLPEAFQKNHRAEVEKFADARVPARLKDQRRKIAGRRKNGEVFPGAASIIRIVFDGKTYFAAIFRDITEEEHREKQVGLQLAMTRAIAEADCFESALSVSLQMVCEITGWDFGEVWLPAPDGQRLQAGSSYCRPDQDLENFRELSRDFKFEMNVGLPGQVWATRKPVWIPDVTVDANFPRVPHARAAGLRAAAGIPILAGERVVAVLDFFLRAERREDENFVALVSSVAAELGAVFARRQAENALRVQEARFRVLIENASDAIALISADGTILYESLGVAHVLGYAVGERTGQTFFELIHPDDQPDVNNRFAQLLQQPGLTISTQLRYRHKDGSWRWLEATGQNLLAEPGVQAIVANYRDITERRRAQIASNLLQTTALAIAEATDFNSALDAALRTLCEATGWKYAEAWVPRADAGVLELGQVWYGGGEQVEKFRSASKGFTFRPGEGLPGRVWATKAPEWIPDVSVNGELFRRASQALEAGLRAGMGVPIIGNGDVLVVAFFMFESRPEDRNIMDVALSIGNQLGTMLLRKRAEENLRQSEEKFRSLIETLPIGVSVATPEGGIFEANPALVKMLGYDSKEEFLNMPMGVHYINPQDRSRFLAQLLEHGRVAGFETKARRKDGSFIWISCSSVMQKRPDGSIAFVNSAEDITERKRAGERLRHSEEKFRGLTENLPIGIIVTTPKGEILEANPAVLSMLGYDSKEEFLQTAAFIHYAAPEDRQRFIEQLAQHGMVTGYEVHVRRKDGALIWASLTSVVQKTPDGAVTFVHSVEDVTERKRADEALRKSEAALHRAQEVGRVGSWEFDLREGTATWSAEAYRLYDVPPGTIPTYEILLACVHPEDRDLVERSRNAVLSGVPTDIEYRVVVRGEVRWLQARTDLEYDASGAPLRGIGMAQDITERKRAEETLRQRLTELELLYESSLAVSQLLQPKEIAQRIIGLLARKLHWHHTTIRLYHPHDETLELLAFNQPGIRSEEEKTALEERFNTIISKKGQGLSGWVVEHGQAACVGDLARDARYAETFPGLQSGLYVPIKIAERVIGVVSIESEKAEMFSESDKRLVAALAAQVASALENARLFQETERRLSEMEALLHIGRIVTQTMDLEPLLQSLLDAVVEALSAAEKGTILLADAEGNLRIRAISGYRDARILDTCFPLTSGYSARAFRTRQPLLIPDVRAEAEIRYDGDIEEMFTVQSAVVAPLIAQDRTIGVIAADNASRKDAFTQEDLHLLTAIASSVALSIQNALLLEETRMRLKRIQALRNIDVAITGSFDVRVIFKVALDEIVSQLGIHAACILELNPHTLLLEYTAGRGFNTSNIEKSRVRMGEGHAGRAALERRTVHIADLTASGAEFARAYLLAGENFTTYYAIPLIAKGHVLGVLEVFNRASFKGDSEWLEFLETLAGQTAIAIDNAGLLQNLEQSNVNLLQAYDETIEGWSQAMDLRDKETEGHTLRVTELTNSLARAVGIASNELIHIRRGALLHDIGKMGIPDNILLKAAALTPEERVVMEQHAEFALKMLSSIAYLRSALDIPYCHHEKWDGTGYPRGLKGEQIPLSARLFAFADVYDALTSDRPYRAAWSKEEALEYIQAQSGKQFDPDLVNVFLSVIEEYEAGSI